MFFILIVFVFALIYVELFGMRGVNWHKRHRADLYTRPSSVPSSKLDQVQTGLQRAKQSRLVICGLACNIEAFLPNTEQIINSIGPMFRDYRVVIFENNSRDGTRKALERWKSRDPKVVLLQGESDHQKQSLYSFGLLSQNRMERMASYRNQYLDWIRENASDWDMVMVMDLDLDGAMCLDGIAQSLAFDWDACAVNGRNPFPGAFGRATYAYDGLVFLLPNDQSKQDTRFGFVRNWFRMNCAVNATSDFIPVRSAFNGCALYKVPSMLRGRYSGERCEHTGLHDSMRANGCGEQYLNPCWRLYSRPQGPTTLGELIF